MNTLVKHLISVLIVFFMMVAGAMADTSMKDHDMDSNNKFGDLIHESTVDGYMLSYYFMDLRDQKKEKKSSDKSHNMGGNELEKPHHLMVYIMDKSHKAVVKGKVGFLIKGEDNVSQKAMGMFMSDGFGTTADMKKKGTYKITTKAVLGKKKLMDSFNYEIK